MLLPLGRSIVVGVLWKGGVSANLDCCSTDTKCTNGFVVGTYDLTGPSTLNSVSNTYCTSFAGAIQRPSKTSYQRLRLEHCHVGRHETIDELGTHLAGPDHDRVEAEDLPFFLWLDRQQSLFCSRRSLSDASRQENQYSFRLPWTSRALSWTGEWASMGPPRQTFPVGRQSRQWPPSPCHPQQWSSWCPVPVLAAA